MRIKTSLSILLLLLCVCISYSQKNQWIIAGKVIDERGSALPFATIYVLDSRDTLQQNILSFTTTQKDGTFTLRTDTAVTEALLVCNYLGYAKKETLVNQKMAFPFEITMQPQTTALTEIVVKDDKLPINSRGDTIVYNASEFRDSTERTVEDLLKKLPGVEVEENGQISVGGKPIKKMMIEGTDMFGRRYTIGSQNIAADFIGTIEVIDHYQENQVVKNIVHSEDIVLNLTLKEDVKNVLSGVINANLGYGDEPKGMLEANIFSVGKKAKHLLLGNSGNTGTQYSLNELQYTYSFDIDDALTAPIENAPIFTEEVTPNYLSFKKPFVDNSVNTFQTIRSFFDLGRTTKLQFNTTYATQDEKQQNSDATTFLYQNESYENLFTRQLNIKNRLTNIELKLNYLHPSQKQTIDFYLSYDHTRHDGTETNDTVTDSTDFVVSNHVKLAHHKLFASLIYTNRINQHGAFFLTGKSSFADQTETLLTDNTDFNLLLPFQKDAAYFHQKIQYRNNLHEFSVAYVHKFQPFVVHTSSVLTNINNSFTSRWEGTDSLHTVVEIPTTKKGDTQRDWTWENKVQVTKKYANAMVLNWSASTFHRDIQQENEQIQFSFRNSYALRFWADKVFSKKLKAHFSYQYQNENPEHQLAVSYLHGGYGFTNQILRHRLEGGHQLRFRASGENVRRLTSYYLGISFRLNTRNWVQNFAFYNSIVNTTPFFTKNNNLFRIYAKWERFVPKVKTNMEFFPSYTHAYSQVVTEGVPTRIENRQASIRYKFSWRPSSHLLFSLNGTLGTTLFETTDQHVTHLNHIGVNPFVLINTQAWTFKTSLYYSNNFNQSQKTVLWGSAFRVEKSFRFRNWQPTFSIDINNFLNVKNYRSITTSDYFIFQNQIEAIAPFFVFGFDYQF